MKTSALKSVIRKQVFEALGQMAEDEKRHPDQPEGTSDYQVHDKPGQYRSRSYNITDKDKYEKDLMNRVGQANQNRAADNATRQAKRQAEFDRTGRGKFHDNDAPDSFLSGEQEQADSAPFFGAEAEENPELNTPDNGDPSLSNTATTNSEGGFAERFQSLGQHEQDIARAYLDRLESKLTPIIKALVEKGDAESLQNDPRIVKLLTAARNVVSMKKDIEECTGM
jgi:hypothetical protein